MSAKSPSSMMKKRCEVVQWLAKTTNISEIYHKTGYSRTFIRKIKNQWENDDDIFELDNKLGAPIKTTTDVQNEIQNLTITNRKMSSLSIANIIYQNPNFPNISRSTVDSVRHKLGFNYLPPIHTFLTTQIQRDNRVKFCKYHLWFII